MGAAPARVAALFASAGGGCVIRILAIDQAKTAGYAVFEDGELMEYGTLVIGRKADVYESILFSAREKIGGLIRETKADMVIIEDIQQQKASVSTYKKLAMLMGALVCLIQEYRLPYDIVPPVRWKSFCGIKGRKREEQKDNTVRFVAEKFNIIGVSEDIADAISMGYFAACHVGEPAENKEGGIPCIRKL